MLTILQMTPAQPFSPETELCFWASEGGVRAVLSGVAGHLSVGMEYPSVVGSGDSTLDHESRQTPQILRKGESLGVSRSQVGCKLPQWHLNQTQLTSG